MLIKRWRRINPTAEVEYCLIWERTKAGWPHIHALLRAPQPSKHWLSHTWNELTRSYVVDMQRVTSSEHAIAYVSKYIAKDPQVPPGQRRWRRSAKMFRAHNGPPTLALPRISKWLLLHRSPEAWICTLLLRGYAVVKTKEGIIHSRDDPELASKQILSSTLKTLRATLDARDSEAITDWPLRP